MSPRYNGATRVRCATISVRINGTAVLTKVAIPNALNQASQEDDKYKHGPKQGQWIYCPGWKREKGYLILQEHDNMVDFKEIKIDAGWLPGGAVAFDKSWQREHNGTTCVDPGPLPCEPSSSSSSCSSSCSSS